jgi:hypothetical protein
VRVQWQRSAPPALSDAGKARQLQKNAETGQGVLGSIEGIRAQWGGGGRDRNKEIAPNDLAQDAGYVFTVWMPVSDPFYSTWKELAKSRQSLYSSLFKHGA